MVRRRLFPFGILPIFRGELLVLGRVYYPIIHIYIYIYQDYDKALSVSRHEPFSIMECQPRVWFTLFKCLSPRTSLDKIAVLSQPPNAKKVLEEMTL